MSAEHRRFPGFNIGEAVAKLFHRGRHTVAGIAEERLLPRREFPSLDEQGLITMIIGNATRAHAADRGVVWTAAADWRAVLTRHVEIPNIDPSAHEWIEKFHRRLKEDRQIAFTRPSVFNSVEVFRSPANHLALIVGVGRVGEYVPILAPPEPFHGAELNLLFEHLLAGRKIDLSRYSVQARTDIKQVLEDNFNFFNEYFQLGLVLEPVENVLGRYRLRTPARIHTADPVIW